MSERDWPSVALCIPTFRRSQGLRKLLTHVGELTYGGRLAVIVVDNDAGEEAGAHVVEQMSQDYPFPLTVVVEPRRGQTYAYNRAFRDACRATPSPDYVAVLDDDEYPDRAWLTEMVAAALALRADIVGGPVLPVFDDPQHWLARSGLYEPPRHRGGPVEMIYGAGSMLIRRSVLEFFTRCRRDGRSFGWADRALVYETTPPSRTTVGWLIRRNFRKGTEITRIDRSFNGDPWSLARRWGRGLALLSLGILALPFAALRGRGAVIGSLNRAARGAGRIAAEFDILYEEYR
jgi:glycosyltransferase involved in cell wall biosynthesis